MQRVLIVDDNPENLRVAATVINNAGYDVMLALNGAEGISCAQQNLPDVILLDIMMPEMDGYEACRQLKKMPETKDIPIIFVSARDEIKDIRQAFEVGGIDHISKPFIPEILTLRVRNHIDRHLMLRNLAERESMLQSLFRSVQQPIALIDNEYNIRYCNLSFSALFELSPEMTVGQKCHKTTNESEMPCDACPLRDSIDTKTPTHMLKTIKGRVYRVDSNPILSDNGEIKFFSLSLNDISDFLPSV